ncbi:MAG: glycosyltransferase family 4 protein [Pseudomonadota bacterium]
MTLRLAVHGYESDPSLPQRDGVNISHGEIAAMMKDLEHPDLKIEFHDFFRLCRDRRYAEDVLSRTDCVLSNIGPHAHYYYYLRERLGRDFRILRDSRTALWSSYLLQEALCQPYLCPGDALIVPSRFARGLVRRVFPHLQEHPVFVFESMFSGLDVQRHRRVAERRPRKVTTLGYVGRLSEDKNFPQLIDLLTLLNREYPGRYRLIACGSVHSPSCVPEKLQAKVWAKTARRDLFAYYPARNHADVWELYSLFDVFLFPSTSSLETLGRVLAEASHCGVPVLASEHAAAPELLSEQALSPVHYNLGRWYATHFDHALGKVDIYDMANKLESDSLVRAHCDRQYPNEPRFLQDLILGRLGEGDAETGPPGLAEPQRHFLDLIEISGLTDYRDRKEAGETIATLMRWFVTLQQKTAPDYQRHLAQLLNLSKHQERTRGYVEKSRRTRADFTNLGGVDMELCHVAKFWPRFRLEDPCQLCATPTSALAS